MNFPCMSIHPPTGMNILILLVKWGCSERSLESEIPQSLLGCTSYVWECLSLGNSSFGSKHASGASVLCSHTSHTGAPACKGPTLLSCLLSPSRNSQWFYLWTCKRSLMRQWRECEKGRQANMCAPSSSLPYSHSLLSSEFLWSRDEWEAQSRYEEGRLHLDR